MPSGALDVINEWSQDRFDDLILEDGGNDLIVHAEPGRGGTMSSPGPIKPRERDAILQSLRAGVVPRVGLRHLQVGRVTRSPPCSTTSGRIEQGGATVRFIIGKYGAGKSFFLNLARMVALERKFVVAQADITTDRRLHGSGGQARASTPN